MKKLIRCTTVLVALAVMAALGGCASPPTAAGTTGTTAAVAPQVQTPAQIAALVCPPIQTALSGLNALAGLPVGAKADLDAVTPLVAGVCAVGTTVNLASLQTLQQTALPAIISAVKASGIAVEQQNSVILDITAAQLILNAITQVQVNAEAAQASPVATPAPAVK